MPTNNGTSAKLTEPLFGTAENARMTGSGPAIWLAGDPEDLKVWMNRGAAGIVTNTVVLNQPDLREIFIIDAAIVVLCRTCTL